MDEEDLAEEAEAQRLQTADGFAGIGSTEEETVRRGRGLLENLFKTEGETMGVELLKKMGWREGQGLGPKVRRRARLDVADNVIDADSATHLFAPENTHMVKFVRKTDHKGLGFDGETKLSSADSQGGLAKSDDEDEDGFRGTILNPSKPKKANQAARRGIGIGILNDTGSDDEDPYEIGPRISYNKMIGGNKKKTKPASNTSIRPVFISKKTAMAKASEGFRKCHDGRLPLDGFVLSSNFDIQSSALTSNNHYPPVEIPEGWKSQKQPILGAENLSYTSTTDAAKASKLDPKARAALLGEAQLPGKSVFDYLSSAARDRLAAASGKTNLPAALGEIPEGFKMTAEDRQKELLSQVPKLEKDTAVAALGRGTSGWMPYADDEGKRDRYRSFLEFNARIRDELPSKAPGIQKDDWLKELQEFAHCARIFKPMTGLMANRFTSSSSTSRPSETTLASETHPLLSKAAPKPEDPAEAAAKVGMFGPMTRSIQDFYPTRLLCKRFNVHPPTHVQVDKEGGDGVNVGDPVQAKNLEIISKTTIDDMMKEHWDAANKNRPMGEVVQNIKVEKVQIPSVDPERNEALEGERAGEAVFKAIFGDSDDEE